MTSRRVPRPMLRPGLRVFRRDDDHLQVGIDDPRVVLRDSPGVRRLLTDLEAGTGLAALTPDAGLALQRLVGDGLVVDGAALSSRAAVTAVFASHGPEAPTRLASRAACRVGVAAPEPWRSALAEWLTHGGLVVAGEDTRPTVTVLVSRGEPARSLVDDLVREDRPHLVVALLADRVRLGPFVVPGVTACLRCLDAHHGERDPRRAVVLAQLEDLDPTATPYDPVLAHAGAALAARELTTYAEGDRPATWSATLTLSGELALPHRTWTRHPHCGCSWA